MPERLPLWSLLQVFRMVSICYKDVEDAYERDITDSMPTQFRVCLEMCD